MHTTGRSLVAACLAALWVPASAGAQDDAKCRFLCSPEFKVEPTWTVSNLRGSPRVLDPDTGQVTREPREVEFEIILALDIPTTVPRLGFTFEAIWTPFARTSINPFTGAASQLLGGAEVRDNPVELEFEANLMVIPYKRTGGWLQSHLDIVDQFSPAERPGDRSTYTHKLDLEFDTAVRVFNALPERNWLRKLEVEVSLDYLASGLPRAGDPLPHSRERFLDNASPWSLSFVLVIPVAPF